MIEALAVLVILGDMILGGTFFLHLLDNGNQRDGPPPLVGCLLSGLLLTSGFLLLYLLLRGTG